MRWILWIIPLVRDRSLDLLTSSPGRYLWAAAAPYLQVTCNIANSKKTKRFRHLYRELLKEVNYFCHWYQIPNVNEYLNDIYKLYSFINPFLHNLLYWRSGRLVMHETIFQTADSLLFHQVPIITYIASTNLIFNSLPSVEMQILDTWITASWQA